MNNENHKSSIVYTCTKIEFADQKSIFYVSLGNNFLLFLWRPLSRGDPGQLLTCAQFAPPPLNPALVSYFSYGNLRVAISKRVMTIGRYA